MWMYMGIKRQIIESHRKSEVLWGHSILNKVNEARSGHKRSEVTTRRNQKGRVIRFKRSVLRFKFNSFAM